MPTISYKKSELRRLVGKKMGDDEMADVISLIKPNIEKKEGEEIEVEHTADRPDLFGSAGLARAISQYKGLRKGMPKYTIFKPKIEVKMSSVGARPYASCAVVRNADMSGENFEGVIKIQEVLSESIGRKRQKVAIGIHDLDRIKGPISYVSVSKGEKMAPLGSSEEMNLNDVLQKTDKGKEYGEIVAHSKMFPAFKDASGIFSFPPILNSDRTKLTGKTRNMFVEVTGTDKRSVGQVMAILASDLAERKFSLESVKLRYAKRTETTPNMQEGVSEISTASVNKMLGLDLSTRDVIDLLSRMGYDAFGGGDKIEVIVPAYRVDILHPVDVIEDVAIAYGLNNMKPEIPNMSTMGGSSDVERTSRKAAMSLVGFGFQEVMSSALSNVSDQFERTGVPKTDIVEIENPSSLDHGCVRLSLLPGLLKMLSSNKHYEYPQNIFEIGDVVLPDKNEETCARNERRVAGMVCHSRAGFAEIKSVLDGMMRSLEMGYSMRECDSDLYIPGRGADVFIGNRYVGSFGELHPKTVQGWDIGMPTAAFEIALE